MWILPYFFSDSHDTQQQKAAKFPICIAWMFLAGGGSSVWETEDTTPVRSEQKDVLDSVYREYCEENGLYGAPFFSEEHQTLFVHIDIQKTKIEDFYTWTDFLKSKGLPGNDLQIWRPFFWLGSSTSETDIFGWRACAEETCLGSFGPVTKIWDTILQTAPLARLETTV
jgi:hypothetical protein